MSRQRAAVAVEMDESTDEECGEVESGDETNDSVPVVDYTRATMKTVKKTDGTDVMFQVLCAADRIKFKRGRWYVLVRFEDGFEVVSKAWLVSQPGDKWQCFFPDGVSNPLKWIEFHPQPFTDQEGVQLYDLVEKPEPEDYFACKTELSLHLQ